jgi:hypothetical protein
MSSLPAPRAVLFLAVFLLALMSGPLLSTRTEASGAAWAAASVQAAEYRLERDEPERGEVVEQPRESDELEPNPVALLELGAAASGLAGQ